MFLHLAQITGGNVKHADTKYRKKTVRIGNLEAIKLVSDAITALPPHLAIVAM
jgi:hypothetical protein